MIAQRELHQQHEEKKVASSSATVGIFSGSKLIAEYLNGSLNKEYIYGGSQLLATLDSAGTPTYHHPDHLSVRVNTNSSGTAVGQQGHYPFGESWYSASTTTKWQFTSYERDPESSLDYAIFRYHSPRLGRFQSPDPIAGWINDPQSLNRYAYVVNDPINFVDPLGLLTCFVDGWEEPCWLAFGLLRSGAGYIPPTGYVRDANDPNWWYHPSDEDTWDAADFWWDDPIHRKIAEVVNNALKEKNLAKCLKKFFGPGTILTNQNLPKLDVSQDLPGIGRTRIKDVPPTGRGTVQIDRGTFKTVPANSFHLTGTYLHEVANALAIQRFIHAPLNQRPYLGPRGGPPTEAQRRDPEDRDIGQQFEKCIAGKD